jgi:hypothetical protein
VEIKLPPYDEGFYEIMRSHTDHPFKLVKWLLQERGVDVYPKFEVEHACGVYYLLGHWIADPVNWHANAHKELEAFEAARCEELRKSGTLTEKDFEHYVVYDSNKHL